MRVNRRGFTVIELLVAVAIFTLAATALVMTQVSAYRAHRKAKEIELATQNAERFVAQLRANSEDLTLLCQEAEAPITCSADPCVVSEGDVVCGTGVSVAEFYRINLRYASDDSEDVVRFTTYIPVTTAGDEEDSEE